MANDLAAMTGNIWKVSRHRLQELFDYDPATGIFTWKIKPNRRIRVGDVAGSVASRYIALRVDGVRVCAHIAAWLYVYGERPDRTIDHKNCDWTDNRIENLRLAGQSMNGANRRLGKNSVGLKGVTKDKRCSAYQARIQVNGEQRHIGSFRTADAAHAAYVEEAKRVFGEFARAS